MVTRPLLLTAALALAVPSLPAAHGPAEIPFTLEGANIVVTATFPNGRSGAFIFDSGLAFGNLVTPEAAKAIGLKADRPLTVHDAGGAQQAAGQTRVSRLQVGAAQLGEQDFGIVPIPAAIVERPDHQAPAAGFLGAPLMRDAVLCLDYRDRRLAHWSRQDYGPGDAASLPMVLNHGLPTIQAQVDGRAATLIVDSGNDGTVVFYEAFAAANDFQHRYPDLVAHEANSGSGAVFEALHGEVGTLQIGPATFHRLPMEIIRQGMDPAWGIDGMIGYGLLSRLNPCLDREGRRFLFEAPQGGSESLIPKR